MWRLRDWWIAYLFWFLALAINVVAVFQLSAMIREAPPEIGQQLSPALLPYGGMLSFILAFIVSQNLVFRKIHELENEVRRLQLNRQQFEDKTLSRSMNPQTQGVSGSNITKRESH